jgi:hypothetical protein
VQPLFSSEAFASEVGDEDSILAQPAMSEDYSSGSQLYSSQNYLPRSPLDPPVEAADTSASLNIFDQPPMMGIEASCTVVLTTETVVVQETQPSGVVDEVPAGVEAVSQEQGDIAE